MEDILKRREKETRMELIECAAGLNDHMNLEAFLVRARSWAAADRALATARRRRRRK